MLQNAWLEANGYIKRRGTGAASRMNPAMAVSKELHDKITAEQVRLGLRGERLVGMSAEENIRLNAIAMRKAGVPEHVVQTLTREAEKHAASITK